MHPFKQKIHKRNHELEEAADKMLALSKKLVKTIGLSDSDVELAVGHNIIFKTKSYIITPKTCCLYNGWHDVLTVLPRNNNISEDWLPCGASLYAPTNTENIIQEVQNVEH